MRWWSKVNWSVVWSVLRTLLVSGGPVATLLIALGFPPVQVSEWSGIALAAIGVLSIAVPGFLSAAGHTDSAKVAAAAALPDVTKIEVKETAKNGVAAAAANPSLTNKVVVEGTKP